MNERFDLRVEGHIEALRSVASQHAELKTICHSIRQCLSNGRKVLACGNGGSACEASHLVEEMVGRYKTERMPYASISLNESVSLLTCISNDFGFEEVFARQVKAIGEIGDVLVIFSTSGNSKNLVRAAREALKKGIFVVGFLGGDGGEIKNLCQDSIIVGSYDSAYIQEAHQFILHWICEFLESDEQ